MESRLFAKVSRNALAATATVSAALFLSGSMVACKAETNQGKQSIASASAKAPATVSNTLPPPANLSSEEISSIVEGLLRQAYGEENYEADTGCWHHRFTAGDEELDYCMKAEAAHVVSAASGTQIYFQTYSDPQAGTYALVNPGLRGLFAASVSDSGKWTPLAITAAMDQGQAGDCGCLDAKLIAVGPDRYGWLSSSVGDWSGEIRSSHQLDVPVGNVFRTAATITGEANGENSKQPRITMVSTGAVSGGLYPIEVTRHAEGGNDSKVTISFDPVQNIYPKK